MNIDLDSGSGDGPPWDLTITHGDRQYAVQQPSGDDLLVLIEAAKNKPLDAWPAMLKLFLKLTGIDESERGKLLPDKVGKFYIGLGAYIEERGKKMKFASKCDVSPVPFSSSRLN